MDKHDRMELRRRRLERTGQTDRLKTMPVVVPTVAPTVKQITTTSVNGSKRCGCSRTKD
jgi:hypothetical protein